MRPPSSPWHTHPSTFLHITFPRLASPHLTSPCLGYICILWQHLQLMNCALLIIKVVFFSSYLFIYVIFMYGFLFLPPPSRSLSLPTKAWRGGVAQAGATHTWPWRAGTGRTAWSCIAASDYLAGQSHRGTEGASISIHTCLFFVTLLNML